MGKPAFKMSFQILLIVLMFLLVMVGTSNAQIIFQKTIGGPLTDYAYDAHKVVNGTGYVMGGVSLSFPSPNNACSYVIRIDLNGDTLWTMAWGGLGGACDGQYVNDLVPFSDGGVIANGGKTVCGDTMKGRNIARLNPDGSIKWIKYLFHYCDPYPVIQSADGHIVSGGYISNGSSNSPKDAFLTKLDSATGDTLWSRRYGGATGDEWFYHILQTPDGGYLSSGFTTTFGQGGRDIYLVKTDANGNLLWSKSYGTAGYESAFGHSIEPTADGGFIVAGQGDNGAQSPHGLFLMKVNSVGTMSWAKYYDGKWGHGVKQTADKGFVLTGGSANGTLLIKTDSLGVVQWSKNYGPASGKGNILELANDGGFLVSGYGGPATSPDVYLVKTDANGVSGCNETSVVISATVAPFIEAVAPSQVSAGAHTITYPYIFQRGGTVTDLCSTVGIREPEEAEKLDLFPNPANNAITLNADSELGLIIVSNSLGEICYRKRINEKQVQLDLSGFPVGMYFVRTQTQGRKFIKE